MTKKTNDREPTGLWVVVVTWAYLLCIAAWGLLSRHSLAALEPNAVGDLLAGIFSPLAFLWLIHGYAMQRYELRMQRMTLQENTLANEEQARQLRDQAAAIREATEIEVAREADARARALQEISPYLHLELAGSVGPILTVNLLNSGATAFAIEIGNIAEGWKRVGPMPGHLRKDDRHKLQFEGEDLPVTWEGLRFQLRFHNQHGEVWLQEFFYENGRFSSFGAVPQERKVFNRDQARRP